MEFHWIDPECDRRLQEGLDEGEADKRRAISHILCDRENLGGHPGGPGPHRVGGGFSLLYLHHPLWGGDRHRPLLRQRGRPVQAARPLVPGSGPPPARAGAPGEDLPVGRAGLGTEGLELDRFTIGLDRKIGLIYQREESQVVRFEPDFSLSEDQMALEQPEGGTFLAFVLLEQPEWDGEQFKRDLRDLWGIPCFTQETGGEDGGGALVFEVDGMTAAVHLYPFPVPHGEAEENAAHNYLWLRGPGDGPAAPGADPGLRPGRGGGPPGGRPAPGEAGVRRLPAGGGAGGLRQRHGLSAGVL